MQEKSRKEECVQLLCSKAKELDKLPVKADFSVEEVAKIKSLLGPWPRALEAAGLKEPKNSESIHKNHGKQIRAKARKTLARYAERHTTE